MSPSRHPEPAALGEAFESTQWQEIIEAGSRDPARRSVALESLLRRYWKPVYCFLRRRGRSHEDAEDLVQGFYQKIVLGRQFVRKADPGQGRFRTFLLTSLTHYVTSVRRARFAGRRHPPGRLHRLDGADPPDPNKLCGNGTPESAFNHAWASALLDDVLKAVERSCRESGQETPWEVFCARVVRPIMNNEAPLSMKVLCERLHIQNEAQASNMVTTVKRRFRMILRHHVRPFVDSDAEVDEEVQELIRILSKS